MRISLQLVFDTNLEDSFVVPVFINVAQLRGDAVMFSHEKCVQCYQHNLLVNSTVT